ncbi:protein kinase domain-containing protein [Haladaptatus salinisoli]|uniref:protein kinase domain-containing protein n=1 Tax=Haladaptatus salinisoli TaxID=2884876 RepID=UPI001D0BD57E|nr:HEAT repeat domain-containing protein [Haladaptatus salinisoli]
MERFESSERELQASEHRERVGTLSTRDVSDLIVSLDADDPKRRASAAWSLAEVAASTPERVPVSDLAQAAADDDRWVRRGATWALAEVAQADPASARPVVERAIDLIPDSDPLVRENAVVAVAGVASKYPRKAEPAIVSLAELRNADDGLVRRYATEALRHVVDALSESTLSGDPVVISVSDPRLADILPAGPNVVQVGETGGDGPIRIGPESSLEVDARTTAENRQSRIGTGPPPDEDIASPPPLSVEYGDFEKLNAVGRSPLVTVHRARASTPSEQHAVATLSTLRSDRREGTLPASFGRAVERWSTIDEHDHVLAVRAHGDSPAPWFAAEFTDGGTLADYFDAGFDASLWFARGIARAVSHAHALGVIHGGLAPSSVRFSTTFGSTWPVPKVGDWGFADVAADAQRPPVPPAFAAPEHVEPESFGVVDHSTDVYGLGALLYALLTGRPPFAGEPHVVVGQLTAIDPPAPTERNPELPDAADDLLGRALAKRKPERYETVDDLLVALERCIETRDLERVE